MSYALKEFIVIAGEHSFEIRLQGKRVFVDGEEVAASMEKVAENLYSLVVDQVSYDVVLSGGGVAPLVCVDGNAVPAVVKDAKTLLLEKYGAHHGKGTVAQSLCAPMPGLVLRVGVTPGDAVQAGEALLVLEAMKMENELRAANAGVVRQVHVVAGEAVAKDALLVEFVDV